MVLRALCREVLFAFVCVFLRLKSQFLPRVSVSRWVSGAAGGGGCSKSITMGDSGIDWGLSGCTGSAGRRERRLAGPGFYSCSPCSEPPGSENLSISLGSITPGLCCVPRALHCRDQRIFPLEVGKTTLAAFLASRLAAGAESGTYFHLTHPLLRW